MSEVTVTFKLDGDDPSDRTGVSEETFNALHDGIAQLGGYDVEIDKS